MSDTPRTDDRTVIIDGNPWVNAPFARQLELELRRACQMYSKLDLHALNLAARITRLEEALEGTLKWIVDLADSGDAGFWNPEEQSVIMQARAALKKEAKP